MGNNRRKHRDATTRFSGKADVYSEFRPSYPEKFIDYLITENDLSEAKVIADIGSGTGKLTAQMLRKGLQVIAVEPNDDMRSIAEKSLEKFPAFISRDGSAENTELKPNSVDLITVAQAFHWFDAQKFKKECQRILKPEGKVALVWNSRDMANPMMQENAAICEKYCYEFRGFSGGFTESPEIFKQFFCNEKYERQTFANDMTYGLDAFIGRNLSSSYAPPKNDPNHNPFVDALTRLFEKYSNQGMVTIPNTTRSYLGKV